MEARQHRGTFVVGLYLTLLVLSSLFTSGRAQAYPVLRGEPSVSLSLTVDPVNAATSPFTVTSTVSFSGGKIVRHYIKAEYQDRTGRNHERIIADRPSSALSVRWILNNADLPEETFTCFVRIPFPPFLIPSTCTDHTTTNARRLAYRGYVSQDGRRLSQGGYAPGIYKFTSEAWIGYSLAYSCTRQDEYGNTYTTTCYSDHIKSVKAEAQGASLYGGLLKTRDLPILLYFYQAKNDYMYKGWTEFSGTIEGPYSNDPGRWGKPWLGGVLAGIRSPTLDSYLKNHGLKGFLADDTSEYPPKCSGICATYEAYDPDWVVGRSEGSDEEVVRTFTEFVSAYARDLTVRHEWYDARSLSSVFDVGNYKAKGFLMLDTPVRTYLFFSRTGLFEENEDLLAIELPAGVGSALRLALRWGEMRTRLKNCTPSSPSALSPCLPSPGNPGR